MGLLFSTTHPPFYKVIGRVFLAILWILCAVLICSCRGVQTYADETKLYADKLGPSSGYNPNVRPLLNQSRVLTVNVSFEIIAIVEIDAIKQQFIVNGFMGLRWIDEIVAWNLSEYGYIFIIHPDPEQIWRPRIILSNTLANRDLFEDKYSPLYVLNTGRTEWYPGSLFPTSCKLNLEKYPFDVQMCYIEFLANILMPFEINFHSEEGEVRTNFYVESGEWDIKSTSIAAAIEPTASFNISFELQRRPGFFIINIVTPIVLMSFLNILVFLIPVESGEKISYGITVLLALTVFMSIVSSQLPRSSDTLPLVTVYLLVLTVISVCTVIVSIAIVYIHHREEKETAHQQATSNFKGLFNKVNTMNRAAAQFKQVSPADPSNRLTNDSLTGPEKEGVDNTEAVFNVISSFKGMRKASAVESPQCAPTGSASKVNRWRVIGRHLDAVSFVVFMVIWVTVTIGFLVEIAK